VGLDIPARLVTQGAKFAGFPTARLSAQRHATHTGNPFVNAGAIATVLRAQLIQRRY
jgi:hypothetical protein